MNYITFPKEEYPSYLNRLNNNQTIYTNRVSKEANYYKLNNIYNSPFGLLKVISLNHYHNLNEHPFINELTPKQINEINKYIKENGFTLIELKKYNTN